MYHRGTQRVNNRPDDPPFFTLSSINFHDTFENKRRRDECSADKCAEKETFVVDIIDRKDVNVWEKKVSPRFLDQVPSYGTYITESSGYCWYEATMG